MIDLDLLRATAALFEGNIEHEDAVAVRCAWQLDEDSRQRLSDALRACGGIGFELTLRIGDQAVDVTELNEFPDGVTATLNVGKSRLYETAALDNTGEEREIVFFSLNACNRWLTGLSPWHMPPAQFGGRTTLRINRFGEPLVGGALRIVDLFEMAMPPFDERLSRLPDATHLAQDVRLQGDVQNLSLRRFALPATATLDPRLPALAILAERSLLIGLVHELFVNADTLATLQGHRRLSLRVEGPEDGVPTQAQLEKLQQALLWVNEEHRDARHALLSAPLTTEARDTDTLVRLVRRALPIALEQARERYQLVVNERKDNYLRELRDALKDIRAQADLYASKIRELVSILARDVLGILLLVGLGLMARLDADKVQSLLTAAPVDAFFKCLAAFFALSATLQVIMHHRDAVLSLTDVSASLKATKDHIPSQELDRLVDQRLQPRIRLFRRMLVAVGLIYLALIAALMCWKSLLAAAVS